MTGTKRVPDLLSEEKKRKSIVELINFFENERDEEIGIIAGENLLDFFLREVGIDLYNKGVEDAMKFIKAILRRYRNGHGKFDEEVGGSGWRYE